MHRREFLGTMASGLLAAPLAAEAQQAGKPIEPSLGPAVFNDDVLALDPAQVA